MNHIKFLNLEIAGKPAASLHHLQHAFPRAEGLPEFLSTCPDCLACKPWVLMHAEPSPFSFLSSRVGKILFFFPSYMHMFGEMYLFLFFFFDFIWMLQRWATAGACVEDQAWSWYGASFCLAAACAQFACRKHLDTHLLLFSKVLGICDALVSLVFYQGNLT